jgi:hypothetical protein
LAIGKVSKMQSVDPHIFKDITNTGSRRRLSILNIPSGSGRLNELLEKYYGQITCIDACSQALIKV